MILPSFLYISRHETRCAARGRRQPFHLGRLRVRNQQTKKEHQSVCLENKAEDVLFLI